MPVGNYALRAQGDPKGKVFGSRVNENESLRSDNDNPHALTLFGDMSAEEIKQVINRVT